MNLKYLKQFFELSEYVSMNQYAAQNNITHAQVSRMVMELEKEFGYQLLIRDKSQSNLKLTKKGEVLVKRIPFIFKEIENMRSLLDHDEELERGNFDLITTTYLVDYWISPWLIDLKKKYPYLTLNLLCREDAPSAEEKKTQFTISPFTQDNDDIIQVKLRDFHIGLWASKKYIQRYGYPEHIADLSRHILICFERNWPDRAYPTMNWYVNNTNFVLKPENVIVIKSSVGIMKAAQEGLGIFSLSEESIRTMNMSFERILPNFEGPIVPMCFSYPKAWQGHKSVKIIETFLLNIFKKMLKE
jgi:DNA-binding transcriptional LysR family regulator